MSSIIRKKLFSQNAGTGGGGSTPTTQIIRYNVANYSALSGLTPNTGEFAYVQNEQGTKWLPGTLGGTYYASGLYYYTGTTWINDLTSIAAQLALNDTAILALQTDKVPYTGATTNVNLGEYGITTGQVNLDLSPTGTAVVGSTRWNNTNGNTETTLLGGNVVLKNGFDLVVRVVNNTGIQLTKAAYQVVKVSGAQGQRLAVNLAQANNDNNSADTLGVVTETINNNQEGFIITVGQLEELNTTGSLQGETWADGDVLYLSPTTPGGITNIKPNGSTGHIVVVGYVEYAHANHGKIYVKIMNGWELEELHDVYIPTYINNGTLYRDTTTNLWKTATIPTILGYTPLSINEVWRGITFNNNSTTIVSDGGITASATASTLAQSVASTNFVSKQVRLRYYASVVSTGRYTGLRGSALLWFIHGGFRFVCDFNVSDTAYGATCQQFYGMAGQTADLAYGGTGLIALSTLTNLFGIGSENGDTNLQVFHNDATGTCTKVDLGVNFPANRTAGAAMTTMYSVTLYNAPTSTEVLYRVVNNETGDIAEGTISTNLPATTQGLNFFASRTMGAAVTNSGQFDLSKLGVYSLL